MPMNTNFFKKLNLEIDNEDVVAYDSDNKEIGRFSLQNTEAVDSGDYKARDGYAAVACHIQVDPKWQRQGVGKALVQEAMKHHGGFSLPSKMNVADLSLGKESSEYFTQEGLALFEACEKDGIILPNQFADYEGPEDEE